MENVRVKELEDFSNDFLRKLGLDEDEKTLIQRPLKTEGNITISNTKERRKYLNIPDFSITNLYRKKNKKKQSLVIQIYI